MQLHSNKLSPDRTLYSGGINSPRKTHESGPDPEEVNATSRCYGLWFLIIMISYLPHMQTDKQKLTGLESLLLLYYLQDCL